VFEDVETKETVKEDDRGKSNQENAATELEKAGEKMLLLY
jgi:hypothetical protein